jgi:hypothetical protein
MQSAVGGFHGFVPALLFGPICHMRPSRQSLLVVWICATTLLVDAVIATEPKTEKVEITANGQSEGLAEIEVSKVENSRWEGTDEFQIIVKARGDLLSSVEPRLKIYGKDSQFIASTELPRSSKGKQGQISSAFIGYFRVNPSYSEYSYCTIVCYNAASTKCTVYKIPLKCFVK